MTMFSVRSNYFFTRAAVAGLVGLAGMSLGCDKSPSAPTSDAAFVPAGPLAVTGVSPRQGLAGETVTITRTGFRQGAILMLDGVVAKVATVTSVSIVATTPVHAAGTVDVVVANAGGQSATLTGGYTFEVISLIVTPDVIAPAGQVTVTWLAPSGRGCIGGGDWLALYRVGDPDNAGGANGHSYLWFEHLCGATSGATKLTMPVQPGQYEIRYMVWDTSVARSSPITVMESVERPAAYGSAFGFRH